MAYNIISREEAKSQGLQLYFTGVLCRNKHIDQRYVSSKRCRTCIVNLNAKFRKNHLEDMRNRERAYRNANKNKRRAALKRWLAANKDYRRDYYKKHNARILELSRLSYKANRAKHLAQSRSYYIKYKDKIAERDKIYRKNNWHKICQRHRLYLRRRKQSDINFAIASKLRNRLTTAIRSDYKTGSAVDDLGCSIADFALYISNQFRDGMSWDNWGDVWELDHIEPLCSFDLTNRQQLLKAVHYTNFQPLTILENRRKAVEDRKLSIRLKQQEEFKRETIARFSACQ